jgi:Raf kinase inhibitor-like YbhB/YbcL family protein
MAMKLLSDTFAHNQPMPSRCAFCEPDSECHAVFSDNRNPQLAWSDPPAGTKSFALICVDPDVPTVGDDVNQEGKTVSASLPRTNFYHWLIANIPAKVRELAEGACSSSVTPRGKKTPPGPTGSIQGINNYTDWFAGDNDMGGDYLGYDGPAPPWNDEIIHHYHFRLLALSVDRLDLKAGFTPDQLAKAAESCTLAQTTLIGTYTLNPALR